MGSIYITPYNLYVCVQVYVEPLTVGDLMFIATTMYPSIPVHTLNHMVTFNTKVRLVHVFCPP